MYSHPLATFYPPRKETNGLSTCNSWGYVSSLTEAYFEKEDVDARNTVLMYLAQSPAPYYHIKSLVRLYKKFKHLSFLREIQCLVVAALEKEVQEALNPKGEPIEDYSVVPFGEESDDFYEEFEEDDED